jgi:hypothetical protein
MADLEYFRYRRQALNAPKAVAETRVILVASQLGLSEEEIDRFYFVRRKGTKNRHFDYQAFAKKYGVSIGCIRRFLARAPSRSETTTATPLQLRGDETKPRGTRSDTKSHQGLCSSARPIGRRRLIGSPAYPVLTRPVSGKGRNSRNP